MPDWKDEVRKAIAGLNLELAREEAIAEELAEHLEAKFEQLVREGASESEAFRSAMEELSEEKLRGELGAMFKRAREPLAAGSKGRGGLWSGLGRDVRLAWRQMVASPGFALVALLSLALGVGANTAIFALIDAVVMRSLPVPEPQQLAEVQLVHGGRIGSTVARQRDFSVTIWDYLKRQQQGFSGLAAWSTERFELGHGGEARQADGLWVSGSFFDVLQLQPAVGRLLSPGDDVKSCGIQGAVISYGFWQSEFGGSPRAVGSTVSVDRHPFVIVGVTPRAFTGLEAGWKFDVAAPLCSEPAVHGEGGWSGSQTTWWLAAIGRLKPGWSLDRATAQLNSAAPGIFAATLPSSYDAISTKDYLRFGFRVRPAATGDSPLRQAYEAPLWVLLAFSGLVLLIACANIANLILAKSSARQHEMALRMALGATRARIARQLLVESLLLATAGTAAGAVLAHLLGRALVASIGTQQDQIYLSLMPDWRMLAFTAGTAVLTCLVFGVAPALQALHAEPGAVVKTAGRGFSAGRQRLMVRRGFIVGQVALSLVLVVAALMFVRTFRNLVNVNVGFEQDRVLVAEFDGSALRIPESRRMDFRRELLDHVRAIPGVASAAETAIVPLSGNAWNEFLDIPEKGVKRKLVDFTEASAGYFATLEVPILAGRDFSEDDTLNSPPVAIVNRAFAQALMGRADATGRTFGVHQDDGKPVKIYRIVGMVGDTKYRDVREAADPIVYVAESQHASPDLDMTVLIRSDLDMASLIATLKSFAARISPEIVLNFSLMRTSIRERLGRERLMAALSGFYGAVAALLATVGLYGIMSYSVARRTGEIGIRIAVGATRSRILAMVLREASTMLCAGLGLGAAMVAVGGRAVQSMLFGLKATDPVTLALGMGGMAAVALLASAIPAGRAAGIDPMQTLRQE